MGDGLKISKDKRHRSSSSIAGITIEGTRSERKLDIRASIPEVDDQFTLAEARCDDLQEKINLVKALKRKRKTKKRSMTRLAEQSNATENIPFITVHTQPKKKVSQQAARLRRLEVPPNPTRGYLDPATIEQHQMIGQVRGYNQSYRQPANQEQKKVSNVNQKCPSRPNPRRSRADGDGSCAQGVQMNREEVIYPEDDTAHDYSDNDFYDQQQGNYSVINNKKLDEMRHHMKVAPANRRRHVPRDMPPKEVPKWVGEREDRQKSWDMGVSSPTNSNRLRQTSNKLQRNNVTTVNITQKQPEERKPVVELFSKSRGSTSPEPRRATTTRDTFHGQPLSSPERINKRVRDAQRYEDQMTGPLGGDVTPMEPKIVKAGQRHPRRVKYRSRRYEMPTVASQMKQAGVRYYYGNSNQTNLPFVVSKSTAPSHNIGVNIQQVLNGLKIQQPLSGIPLTIAHHMGLGHIPTYGTKSVTVQPSLDNREINAIKLGRRLLRLPSYKYMSYNRLLNLYREGDGMVPRFLRAISRPHYFYTSMYNLATNREDFDGATSKGRGASNEAKQSLADYARLYREYEQIDLCLKEGNNEPEWERRRDELSRELAAREEHIRKVVQEYRTSTDVDQSMLRASASNAEDGYRSSTFKLNLGDGQIQH